MYGSPASRYKARVLAAESANREKIAMVADAAAIVENAKTGAKEYHQLLTAIRADCVNLSTLPSGSGRLPAKRNLVATWLPFVERYLKGDDVYRNEIMTQVMIWLFDLGEIDDAIRIGLLAIEQKQAMPERFKRDVRTYVADAVLAWAQATRERDAAASIDPYFWNMLTLVLEWPVHDQIKLQYLKFAAQEKTENYPTIALDYYRQAVALDPTKAKCKTAIDKLEKRLAAESPQDEDPPKEE
jgi:hypothetical protein